MESTTPNLVDYYDVIVKLIIDDLKIAKLLQGLSQAGLEADRYQPKINEAVFFFVGLEKEQNTMELKEWYNQQVERVYNVELTESEKLYEIASEIFLRLNLRK
jgi:hypothetical protein